MPETKRQEPKQWFAMRALYRREMRMKEALELEGIESFVPMKYVEKRVGGRIRRFEEPAIAGLMFVHSEKSVLQAFKSHVEYFQYICSHQHSDREKKIGTPIIVPDDQMEAFIRLCMGTEDPLFINPEMQNLAPGTPVRVIGGPFIGMTGVFQRVQGKRSRMFVIQLRGILSVAATISVADLEVIK